MGSRPEKKPTQSAVLSHTTILILSAFLFGLVAGQHVSPVVEMYVYLAGIIGLIAYFGLGLVSSRRERLRDELNEERSRNRVQTRINRHIPRQQTPVKKETEPVVYDHSEQDHSEQYVTVVGTATKPT